VLIMWFYRIPTEFPTTRSVYIECNRNRFFEQLYSFFLLNPSKIQDKINKDDFFMRESSFHEMIRLALSGRKLINRLTIQNAFSPMLWRYSGR
jgi:uncharacterized membrane-anchored protein YjiN (DUF445 family)